MSRRLTSALARGLVGTVAASLVGVLPQLALADDAAALASVDESPDVDGSASASADASADAASDDDDDDDRGTQGIGVAVGIATGGRTTPGGLRIAGHYTYQMSSTDWFDGSASFTFGGGGAACFRDRDDTLVCEHGYLDGAGAEITAGVRRYFASNGGLQPFARLGLGISVVRFGDDDLTGIAVPLHGAVGLRRALSSKLAIVAASEVMIGLGRIGRAGPEPQAGFAITAGAELRLR